MIAGIICIVASFIFMPKEDNSKKNGNVSTKLNRAQADNITRQVDKIIADRIEALSDKTEISMEKLSNKKIMEISEYSDTVLAQIKQNHDEVMFLYDMLNEKTKSVKNVVSKKVEEPKSNLDKKEINSQNVTSTKKGEATLKANEAKSSNKSNQKNSNKNNANQKQRNDSDEATLKRTTRRKRASENSDGILKLYNQGMESTEIAKKLGVGIGEVRLVIDLYKGGN